MAPYSFLIAHLGGDSRLGSVMCGNGGIAIWVAPDGQIVVTVDGDGPGESIASRVLRPVADIIEDMVLMTEVRGGQAGGVSALNFGTGSPPKHGRVRTIARKRRNLAGDLRKLMKRLPLTMEKESTSLCVIAHTRFATGSRNIMPELHPHIFGHSGYHGEPEHFTPREERVWLWSEEKGLLSPTRIPFVAAITHNGDFEAYSLYSQMVTNGDLGAWLELALRAPDSTKGDSPKIAGLVSLLRVQGRMGAAARLAWLRTGCADMESLTPDRSPPAHGVASLMPPMDVWEGPVAMLFEDALRPVLGEALRPADEGGKFYFIDWKVVTLAAQRAANLIKDPARKIVHVIPGSRQWTDETVAAFAWTTLRGFLRSDLSAAMSEILTRGHGSFGVQAQCTLDEGIVVLGCKGQPMAVAFANRVPTVLFGSERSALTVAVTEDGRPLDKFLQLDEVGEVVRLGPPAALIAGTYSRDVRAAAADQRMASAPPGPPRKAHPLSSDVGVVAAEVMRRCLPGGARGPAESPPKDPDEASSGQYRPQTREELARGTKLLHDAATCAVPLGGGSAELRVFSLDRGHEVPTAQVLARCQAIESPTVAPSRHQDLVQQDLRDIPEVVTSIDREWADPESPTTTAATDLADHLCRRLVARREQATTAARSGDQVDLLIGGVEVSLWLAEQFAADLRIVFPSIVVRCVSANKLLGVRGLSPRRTYFPTDQFLTTASLTNAAVRSPSTGAARGNGLRSTSLSPPPPPARMADQVLLISQSGQTFPTLHATRLLAEVCPGRCWLLTGAYQSQMATALGESIARSEGASAPRRVMSNLSGHRPAEPSSVAAVAAHHTLSRLLVHIAVHVRRTAPSLRTLAAAEENRPPQRLGAHKQAPAMRLSDMCIADLQVLLAKVHSTLADLVGVEAPVGQGEDKDQDAGEDNSAPRTLQRKSVHRRLVRQGQRWARHVNELWAAMIIAGAYVVATVGTGCPVFSCAARALVEASAADASEPESVNWTIQGAIAALLGGGGGVRRTAIAIVVILTLALDVAAYIFAPVWAAMLLRIVQRRPLWARFGKRTLVIVESPANHQLLETFVSKLFAQSYSFCGLDVHGASGQDHFVRRSRTAWRPSVGRTSGALTPRFSVAPPTRQVHRFTHRVARGLLIAVGRPDGRLSSLSKTEAAVLLACKQAAFIENSSYPGGPRSGNSPEVVSCGQNPFPATSAGISKHIHIDAPRRPFIDEIVFHNLHRVPPGFASRGADLVRFIKTRVEESGHASSLQRIGRSSTHGLTAARAASFDATPIGIQFVRGAQRSALGLAMPGLKGLGMSGDDVTLGRAALMIRGISMMSLASGSRSISDSSFEGNNPAVRQAFASKLDAETLAVQDRVMVLHVIHESRVAAIERYVAFCVMFHAMADACCRPFFRRPWDVARSQSNLRIATTAAPIVSSDAAADDGQDLDAAARMALRRISNKLSGVATNM